MGALTKDRVTTLVSAYVSAVPAIEAIPFHMYATPLPLGLTYRQVISGDALYPNSAATFANWSQVVTAPPVYATTPGPVTYVFQSLESLFPSGAGSVSIPADWTPVYATVTFPPGTIPATGLQLTGYLVPTTTTTTVALPPRYYGPIAYMTYVRFSGVEVASNGYPLGAGPFVGTVDVPTLTSTTRLTRTFTKDTRGVLIPESAALPAYCSEGGSARILMLADFPGRPATPARAAVVNIDYRIGWNAGANSIEQYDGDVFTHFTPVIGGAGAVGLSGPGAGTVGEFVRLSHAWYFDTDPAGGLRATPMEAGRLTGAPTSYAAGTAFELRRVIGVVTYLKESAVMHTSATPSGGILQVGAALYHADDGVL